jgi:hypothetical protein
MSALGVCEWGGVCDGWIWEDDGAEGAELYGIVSTERTRANDKEAYEEEGICEETVCEDCPIENVAEAK